MEKRWFVAGAGLSLGAIAATALVGPVLGIGVALVGAAGLALLRRRISPEAAPRAEAGQLNERQRRTLPTWYAEREVFPVPSWAWVGVALLLFTPYLLGQVHVLSEAHAGTWLVIGFVASGVLLYAAGTYERAKARRRTS